MTVNFSSSKMKADTWLAKAAQELEQAGIGSARLDALIILEDCLEKDRGYILAHPDMPISKTKLKRLNSRLRRREKHLPMAYIRGWTEFYGRKFKVNRHVLEPRPESETMIELLKMFDLPKSAAIADIGTGSGCLGITAALELHNHNVDLYDIDANALAVAKHNLAMHELSLKVYKRDLLKRPNRHYQVILANLPYIPNRYRLNKAATMEPKIAFFGGEDGLDVYRRLLGQLQRFYWKPSFVLTESLPPQHDELAKIAERSGFQLTKSQDFIQVFRSS